MKTLRRPIVLITIAIPLVVALAILSHYQVWLRSFTGEAVTVIPGKWVWVECHTQPFKASIESIGLDGVTIESQGAVSGLPCPSVGISSLGNNRYFFPFRTILAVKQGERYRWRNPFPI